MDSKMSWAIVALLFSGAAETADNGDRAAAVSKPTASRPEAATKVVRLKHWEPVDASFNGCSEGLCGSRGQNARAVVQPGANVGDYAYCVVSGAVFQIKDSHFSTAVNGKTLYFCCEGCARYFAANRARVLALRGLAP